MNQYALILKSLDIIIESRLWEDRKPSEIFNILMYVHTKGWLYTPVENGEIVAVVCAYKIPEVNEDTLKKMPLKEEGNILYAPFVLSIKKDVNLFHVIRESCKAYLEQNPEVEEIVLEDKNNKIKRFPLKTLQGV